MTERRETVTTPFDFRRTLGALGVGTFDEAGTWWWARPHDSGPSTIAVRDEVGSVFAQAWGPHADELVGLLPDLVGAHDASTMLIGGAADDLLRRSRGLRLGRTRDVHSALFKAVLGQVVTTSEAGRSSRALRRRLGQAAPGPRNDLKAIPSASAIAALPYETLHSFGIERKRAQVLIEAARRMRRLDEILAMDREDAYSRLEAVRGIGPWTSAMVMGIAWGDTDAVLVGDYHLPNAVAWALAGEERGSDARMLDLLEPYRPHRRRVLMAIKQLGIHAPRYGPRTPVRDHL